MHAYIYTHTQPSLELIIFAPKKRVPYPREFGELWPFPGGDEFLPACYFQRLFSRSGLECKT